VRRATLIVVLTAIGAVTPALAAAQPAEASILPHYAVETLCGQMAEVGDSRSEALYARCIHDEQTAYDRLKPLWPTLSAQTRSECDEMATGSGDGSYALLAGCVERERRAPRDTPTFQY
jgi:hypothetical protein